MNNNSDDDGATLAHHAAAQEDVQLRKMFSSLPVSSSEAEFGQRVLARVHRRKISIRATWAASLIVLLVTGWYFRDAYPSNGGVNNGNVANGKVTNGAVTDGEDLQQPSHVVGTQPTVDADQSPVELTDEVALFLIAYKGISSPVSDLETLENEPQALLNYLSSLKASLEIQ